MPFSGSGTFSPFTPGNPVVSGATISASAFNNTITDLANGLSNTITRDGQSPATADIPMGGFRITGLAAGINPSDAARLDQAIPTGTLLDFAGTSAPAGFVLCDGTSYTTAAQPALFAAIGYTWGGSGGNFNVPDLRRKTTIGSGGTAVSGPANTVGATGGTEAIAATNLPQHVHAVSLTTGTESATHTHTDAGHAHGVTAYVDNGTNAGNLRSTASTNPGGTQNTNTGYASLGTQTANHTHTVSGNTGNGPGSASTMTNMQPSAVVTKIIKT